MKEKFEFDPDLKASSAKIFFTDEEKVLVSALFAKNQ